MVRALEERSFDMNEDVPRSLSPFASRNASDSIIQASKASIFQRATNKRDLLLLSKKAVEETEKRELPQIKIYLNQVMEPAP